MSSFSNIIWNKKQILILGLPFFSLFNLKDTFRPSFLVLFTLFHLIAFLFCCLYKANQMDEENITSGEWCPNKHYHINNCINQQAALYRSSTVPSTHSTFILYPNFSVFVGTSIIRTNFYNSLALFIVHNNNIFNMDS